MEQDVSRGLIPSPPTLFLPQPYILTVDKTLQSAALGFLCPHYAAHAVSSRENQFCKFSCRLFHFSTLNFSCQLFPAHVNWVLPATEGRVQSAAAASAATTDSQSMFCFHRFLQPTVDIALSTGKELLVSGH